jgi:cytochrome c-type biogenesis protein CcmH
MTFWLLACSLVALIVLFTLMPMLRKGEEEDSLGFARAFYQEREAELKAQRDAGEIDQAVFDAALAEQGRRLITLAKSLPGTSAATASTLRRKLAALLMLLGVPLLGIGLYLKQGRPGMPDAPLVARQVAPKDFDIASAIEKIEAHLAKNPGDGRGFEVVAPVYMKAERYADAVHAYRQVLALLGENAQRHADLGEALVAFSSGIVSGEAKQAFDAALRLEGDLPKARYYVALALEQEGKGKEALATLEKLRDDLADSPARSRVVNEIARLKGAALPPAPSPADALAALPEKDRAQAIAGMVDGLEQRLDAQGGAPEDWQKLVRARLVLGQKERAGMAFEKAKTALKDKPETAALIEALASALKAAPDKTPENISEKIQ